MCIRDREGAAAEELGNTGLANINRTPAETKAFKQAWAQQVVGPFKHHHILDMKFVGDVLNRTDAPAIVKHLRQLGVEVGDRARNIIGAMDQKTNFIRAEAKNDIIKELGWNIESYSKGTKEQKRLLDDLLKQPGGKEGDFVELRKGTRDTPPETLTRGPGDENPLLEFGDYGKAGDPASYGLPRGPATKNGYEYAKLWPEGTTKTPWGTPVGDDLKVTNAHKREAYQNRWKTNNINKKNIKFSSEGQILAKDHMELIHGAYDSPDFILKRRIEAMVKSGEWRTIPPRQAAEQIAAVYQVKRNIVLNVAKKRLRLIKRHLRKNKTGQLVLRQGPESIREWILKNSRQAANLGWIDGIPNYKTLSLEPKFYKNELQEIQVIFATELEQLQDLTSFAEQFGSRL